LKNDVASLEEEGEEEEIDGDETDVASGCTLVN
jgi:hypothetical protein